MVGRGARRKERKEEGGGVGLRRKRRGQGGRMKGAWFGGCI